MYMSILVKNATNTSDLQPPYPYNTWIEFWESRMGKLILLNSIIVLLGVVKKFVTEVNLTDAMYKRFSTTHIRCISSLCVAAVTIEMITSLLTKTF